MLTTSTAIVIFVIHGALLCAYYVIIKFQRAGMWASLSQNESLELLKKQMAEDGYDTKTIDFWLEQEVMMLEQHRRKVEDMSIKHDSLFFLCWCLSMVVVMLIFAD